MPLALAAGACYGVTAGLISSLTHTLDDGPVAVLGQWQTYAIVVIGPLGVLLARTPTRPAAWAPALATFTVTDPLVAIAVGLLWLDERIRTGPWNLLGEVVALGTLVVGVFLLARRAPRADPAGTAPPGGTGDADAPR